MRIYSGPDGESHFEDLTSTLTEGEPGPSPIQAANAIFFSRLRPGGPGSWHTAPRRQYVIGVAGEVEITVHDGTALVFGPGDVLLAEDLTGRGHLTRVVGEKTRVSAMIPLADV